MSLKSYSPCLRKKLADLDRRVTEELAGINARLDSILDVGKARPERPAR